MNLRADQPDIGERIDLLIREQVQGGVVRPGADARTSIAKLKDAGVVTMPTVGARRHAEKVAEWGVDAVIAQGAEGGGHTGTVPTSLLLPAGGRRRSTSRCSAPAASTDGRGLVAALAWGADGHRHGHPVPADAGRTVPDDVKDDLPRHAGHRHGRHHRDRRRTRSG